MVMDVQELVSQVDPLCRSLARKYTSTVHDAEDFEQELRLFAVEIVESWDPEKGPWGPYASSRLRFRAIDLLRANGLKNRSGRQRRIQCVPMDYIDQRTGERVAIDPVDPSTDLDDLCWAEVGSLAASRQDHGYLAAYLVLSGMTNKQAAEVIHVSEGRVSQMLSDERYNQDIFRWCNHKPKPPSASARQIVPQEQNSNWRDGVSNLNGVSVEEAVDLLMSEGGLAVIDSKIKALEAELEKLKRFRKAVGGKAKVELRGKATEGEIVRLVKTSRERLTAKDIAKHFDCSTQGVAICVSKSDRLSRDGEFVVLK